MRLAERDRLDGGTILPFLTIPTFVRVIGAGPPVFVLHGGPGFSHDHLVAPLRGLAERRSLVFFDQPGCGRSGGPERGLTADLVARHFRALVEESIAPGQPFGVIAHSWGAAVLFGADLVEAVGAPPAEGLLVAPVATTRPGWDAAAANLLARIPPALATAFLASLGSEQDTDCGPLLPFYCATAVPPRDADLPVRGRTYLAVIERLGDYDLHAQARRALPHLDLALGRFDFTPPDLISDVIAAARRTSTLDTGHFPFWEDPVAFEAALQQAFA